MRMYDIIKAKRDGKELKKEQIDYFISGYVSGRVPDYQASALLMAIYFNGMTDEETADLTYAIRDSGRTLSFDAGLRADKHSTGGVGDKTSLIVMPIVASLGVKSLKMSGRGLGHTGGTIDKLQSIEGFKVDLSPAEAEEIVKNVGIAIIGQTEELAPADKLLYALRDVTATVDSIPLIASSIMGKKLAAGDDCIVLDVKTGSGAFMKSLSSARKLASLCVQLGKRANKRISALITNMDCPLGNAIGNSLEVVEAIDTLKGHGPNDLTTLSLELAAEILRLCDMGSKNECLELARHAIESGAALKTFADMVSAQGGKAEWIYSTELFPAAHTYEVRANKSGFITKVNAEGYGLVSLMLGAGRNSLGDKIDLAAGITIRRKVGDYVCRGEAIATLHSNKDNFVEAEKLLLSATKIGGTKPKRKPLIFGIVEG